MSEQQINRVAARPVSRPVAPLASAAEERDDPRFEALLDEIDAVIDNNPEDYVRSFVQKGGQ